MTLCWPPDAGDVETAQPRLHALVIGVGDYDHLGLAAVKKSRVLNGLGPLSITTPAARRIARWLENEYVNPGRPLGSIELLLSPGVTLQRADGSEVPIEKATMANIRAAFKAWYARCDSSEENIAFFYFAGHGISTVSKFLLPADFGNPDLLENWDNCIDGSGLVDGMATRCKAQTQFFFLDACRDAPIGALTEKPTGDRFVSPVFGPSVDLSAIYAAASEGRQAFGRDGEETFFCQALIKCFEGMGARKSGPQWRVDAASLSTALVSIVETIGAKENQPLSCECTVQKPVVLHFPAGGRVLVKVDCETPEMNAEADITLTQAGAVQASPPGGARPWTGEVEAGQAHLEVRFQSFPDETVDDLMLPPTYNLELAP